MKLVLKWGLLFLLALIACACLLVFWLGKTESGLHWLVNRIPQVTEVRGLSGSLSEFKFEILRVDFGSGLVTVRNGQLHWEPIALGHRQVLIETLETTDVQIKLHAANKTTPFTPWQGLNIPATVRVQNADIKNLSLQNAQHADKSLEIASINAQAQIENNQLRITKLAVGGLMGQAQNHVAVTGTLDLSARPRGLVDLETQVQWQFGEQQLTTHGRVHGQWRKLALEQTVTSPLQLTLSGHVVDLLSTEIHWESQIQSQPIQGQNLLGKPLTLEPGKLKFDGRLLPEKGLTGLTSTLRGSVHGGNPSVSFWALDADVSYAQDTLTVHDAKLTQQDKETPITVVSSGSIAQLSQGLQKSIVDLKGEIKDATWPLLEANPLLSTDVDFELTGRYGEYALVTQAHGSLQSHPMQADLNILFGVDKLSVNEARFSSGQTRASIEGEIGQMLALNWHVDAPDLNEILPQMHGSLVGQGKLTGSKQSPIFDASLDAESLHIQSLAINKLAAQARVSLYDADAPIRVALDLSQLQINTQVLTQQLNLDVVGTNAKHTLTLNSDLTAERKLTINGTGRFIEQAWSGLFDTLELSDPALSDWKLREPMAIEVAKNKVTISNTCFVNSLQSVCAAFEKTPTGTAASAQLQALQLANLNRFMTLYDLRVTGVANGSLQFTQPGTDSTAKFSGELQSDDALISWESPNDEQLETESLAFKSIILSMEQQTNLALRADIALDNNDHAHIELNVAQPFGSTDFQSATIEGSTRLAIADLSVMPPSLLNDINLNGQLNIDAIIAGTVATPTIDVTADIHEAVAKVHPLGLNLKDINLQARSNGSPQIQLTGGLQSGEGQVQFNGVVDVQQLKKPVISLTLSGQNLQLANTNDMLAVGDLDIQTTITNDLIDVSGEILIAQAELDFKVPESAVLASDDVILEGDDTLQTRTKQKLDLTIDLGSKTHFQAQGLDATLAGKIRVYQRPNGIVRGEGQINVQDGRYTAYEQDLAIDQGKLVFTGGSIDDPTLDIRAQKTVNAMTAGVAVSGRARSPRLNLYSTPTMPDQDILSVLIFDKPVTDLGSQDGITLLRIANSLRGDGQSQSMIEKTTSKIQQTLGLTDLALDINRESPTIQAGKQLSSKFYVGYGYGLLDATQSLILKYQLNDAWSIKADVGADSGADLRYQIER